MPTYEYRCERCGTFEAFQAITESPLQACPTCGGPVERLISRNVNILFKGSGFHVTDYRSKSYKDAAKKEESSVGSSGSSLDD
ncbi:FmdB family zinc ribbon protein [Geochorda subterranea]|uniref:FmdB family zinc ribbon protein n=1 Tax=Geochorda subterranea TaxID=3109564 RepID=A0ABZ1BNG3_9FIRM|nr:FmdB family zinc ribbon protein [Limnochorda sp. LNt]WRP14023.1 FmdB family zinc ribbon protein [Limnochorda sp. LNt]